MTKILSKHVLRSIGLAAIGTGLLVSAGLAPAPARVVFGFSLPQ